MGEIIVLGDRDSVSPKRFAVTPIGSLNTCDECESRRSQQPQLQLRPEFETANGQNIGHAPRDHQIKTNLRQISVTVSV